MSWEKLPPIAAGSKGCLCCGELHTSLPMDALLAVGFGDANVTRDGALVYSEEEVRNGTYWTAQQAEKLAEEDPDHDWRILL